jgi:hypothetical protein
VPTFRRAAAPPSWIAVLRRGMVGGVVCDEEFDR